MNQNHLKQSRQMIGKVFALTKANFFLLVKENLEDTQPAAVVVNSPPDYYYHNRENRKTLALDYFQRLKPIFKGKQDCLACIWSEPFLVSELQHYFSDLGFRIVEKVAFIMLGYEKKTSQHPVYIQGSSYVRTSTAIDQQLCKLSYDAQFVKQSHKSMLIFRREADVAQISDKNKRNADVILGEVKSQR